MRASIAQQLRSLPVWWSGAIWLALLASPTAYCVLLVVADRWQAPALPASFVVLLFCLVPLVALLGCGMVVWLSRLSLGWRVGWLVLTVLAMLLQVGAWVVIIVGAITTAISLAQ